jgi:hypothetical protein
MQMSNKLASFGKRVFLGMTLFLDDWNFANLFLYMPRSWHHVLKHCSSYLRFTLLEYLQQILCFASFGWGPLLGSRWCSLLVVISPISMNDSATAALSIFNKSFGCTQMFWESLLHLTMHAYALSRCGELVSLETEPAGGTSFHGQSVSPRWHTGERDYQEQQANGTGSKPSAAYGQVTGSRLAIGSSRSRFLALVDRVLRMQLSEGARTRPPLLPVSSEVSPAATGRRGHGGASRWRRSSGCHSRCTRCGWCPCAVGVDDE